MKTKIEWADRVWNPITGCSKISQGCKNCYAETMAKRFWGERTFSEVQLHEERLTAPSDWKKPSTVFVNSMSDLFHEDVSWHDINRVFQVMKSNKQHTFLILTKRPYRMLQYFQMIAGVENMDVIAPHIWLGVSVEDQNTADERIPLLLEVPAANRFVSCEPLLGQVDLENYFHDSDCNEIRKEIGECICSEPREVSIDWIIVGGESGPKARPMNPDWVSSIKDQCLDANTPFFFKQWGTWRPEGTMKDYIMLNPTKEVVMDSHVMCKVGKTAAGRELDGKTWNQRP